MGPSIVSSPSPLRTWHSCFRRISRWQTDAAAIAEIYNQGIEDRMATLEVDPRSVDDVASALRARLGTYPAVVVEEGGRVFAFAWASPYSSSPCYSGIAEQSVYVARAARGSGYGRMALQALIDEYEQRGFWNYVAIRIMSPNHSDQVHNTTAEST